MTDQNNRQEQTSNQSNSTSSNSPKQSGDPGRTPGTAEGDEKTVDESLKQKDNQTK